MTEKRQHPRIPLAIEASIESLGEVHPCKVIDFSLGGLKLQVEGAPFSPDEIVTLSIPLQQQTYSLKIRIHHVSSDIIGVSFYDPRNPVIKQLDFMARNQAIVKKSSSGQSNTQQVFSKIQQKSIIDTLKNKTEKHLNTWMEELLALCDTYLLEKAVKSSDYMANELMEHGRLLKENSSTIARHFNSESLYPIDSFALKPWVNSFELPGQSEDTLKVVDQKAFEDWLLVRVMISKCENGFRSQLIQLQLRLNALTQRDMAFQDNPFGPYVICTSFKRALEKSFISTELQKIVLNQFSTYIQEKLAIYYGVLNQELKSEGILPNIQQEQFIKKKNEEKEKAAKKPNAKPEKTPTREEQAAPNAPNKTATNQPRGTQDEARGQAQNQPAARSAPASTSGAETPDQKSDFTQTPNKTHSKTEEIFDQFSANHASARDALAAVKQLRAMKMENTSTPESGSEPAPESEPLLTGKTNIDDTEFVAQLSTLQGSKNALDHDSLNSYLTESLSSGDIKLSEEQFSSVETIDGLFQAIGSSDFIAESIRALLRLLEIPFLKLLLGDNDFLDSENHPARKIVNNIARLGGKEKNRPPKVDQVIEHELNYISENFTTDVSVFVEANENIEKEISLHTTRKNRNISKLKESFEGRKRLSKAKQHVDKIIEIHLSGKEIPLALDTLIKNGWQDLLVHTIIRKGNDSKEWHTLLGVVDDLASLANPKTAQKVNQTLILSIIKSGLSKINAGNIHEDIVSQLKELFIAYKNKEIPQLISISPGEFFQEEDNEFKNSSKKLRKWIKKIRNFKEEQCIKINDEGTQYLHLAWFNDDKNHYVFVNHLGLKVLDMKILEIAEHLESGYYEIADDYDKPFIDRSLELMVQDVYSQFSDGLSRDSLTGLLNRQCFEKEIETAINQAQFHEKHYTLVYMGLDQFQVINNVAGFQAGDAFLKQIAEFLEKETPDKTVIARLGGDEFGLLFNNCKLDSGRFECQEIRRKMEEIRLLWEDKPYSITGSFGIVEINDSSDTSQAVLEAVTLAYNTAKDDGKNRLHVFDADDKELEHRMNSMKWITLLNEALDNNKLVLRCQLIHPIHPNAGLKPHYEILVSIQGDDGLIPPFEYINAAERFNRMQSIDRWVIENTLLWVSENPDKIADTAGLSINLSGHSLNDETLMEFIFDRFNYFQTPRNKITFEITETTAVSHLEDTKDFIEEMQSLGCLFSLDDFGTGLASFSYLKNLPVDYVKIDGCFVKDMMESKTDLIMVKSITEMCHFMGKKVVAEFVENDEILKALDEIGVDFAQGFGIEKPKLLATL